MLNSLYLKLDEAKKDLGISSEIIKGTGSIDGKIALVYENKNHLNDALNIADTLKLSSDSFYTASLLKYNLKNCPDYKNILEFCAPFLFEEIKIINPAICVSIGSNALKAVTADKTVKLKELRGKPLEISGLIIFPVYTLKSSYYSDIAEQYNNDMEKLKEIVSYIL